MLYIEDIYDSQYRRFFASPKIGGIEGFDCNTAIHLDTLPQVITMEIIPTDLTLHTIHRNHSITDFLLSFLSFIIPGIDAESLKQSLGNA